MVGFGVFSDRLPKNKSDSLIDLAKNVGLDFKEDGDYVIVSIKSGSPLADKCTGDKIVGKFAKLASGKWIKQ